MICDICFFVKLPKAEILHFALLHVILLSNMKHDIHPKYFPEAKVTCACGNSFTVGSTMEKIEVEICSACHPFYTGAEKILDSAGRVGRFKARAAKKSETVKKKTSKKTA